MKDPERRFLDSSVLRYEAFRALWLAATFSNIGTFVQDVGESWLMMSLTRDPLPVALLTTAFTVPGFVLMMPAGLLADRVDRRKVLLCAQSALAITAALLALATWLGWTTPAVLLTSSAVLGIGSAVSSPAWASMVPELVPREETADAVTLNSVAFNLARAVGPAIGGLVLAARGPATAFFLNAVSFLAVIEVLRRYEAFKTTAAKSLQIARNRPHEPIVHALFGAVREVKRNRALLAAHLSVAAFGLTAASVTALLPVLAKETLHASSRGYGIMLGGVGVGAVTAAFLLKRMRALVSSRGLIAGAYAIYGFAVLGLSVTRSLPVATMLLVPAGVGWLSGLSTTNALVQLSSRAHVKARVLALYQMAFWSTWSVGATIGGAVANRIGAPATIGLAGVGVLGAALFTSRLAMPRYEGEPIPSDALPTPAPVSVR